MWVAALLLALLLVASLFVGTRGAEGTHYYPGYRWEGRWVYWRTQSWPPPPPASFLPVIESAAWDWGGAWSGFNLWQGTASPSSGAGQGVVGYVPFDDWFPAFEWGLSDTPLGPYQSDGSRYLVSVAFLWIDSDKQWNLNNQGDFNPVGNLRAVALHEFGHWIKLGHTGDSSIMCPPCVVNQGKKTVSAHDISSLKAVYPYPSGGGVSGNPGGIPK